MCALHMINEKGGKIMTKYFYSIAVVTNNINIQFVSKVDLQHWLKLMNTMNPYVVRANQILDLGT